MVAGAGCGGGTAHLSKKAYEARVQAIGSRMGMAMKAAYAPVFGKLKLPKASTAVQIRPSGLAAGSVGKEEGLSRKESERVSRLLASAFDQAATELASLKPPADARADNRKLATGLRFLAGVSLQGLTKKSAKAEGALTRSIEHSSTLRAFWAAQKDLQRMGYKLGSFAPSGGDDQSLEKSPQPKEVPPLPFALVSRSGRQPASELHAATCPPHPAKQSCIFLG
jgi:hypothetical protein